MEWVIIALLAIALVATGIVLQRDNDNLKGKLAEAEKILASNTEAFKKIGESDNELLTQLEAQNKDRDGLVAMLEKSREIIQKLNDSLKDTTDSMVSSDRAITELKELLNSDREYIVSLEDKITKMKKKAKEVKKPKAKKRK